MVEIYLRSTIIIIIIIIIISIVVVIITIMVAMLHYSRQFGPHPPLPQKNIETWSPKIRSHVSSERQKESSELQRKTAQTNFLTLHNNDDDDDDDNNNNNNNNNKIIIIPPNEY